MNTRIIGIDLAVTAEHKAMVLDPASNSFIGRPICFRARPDDLNRLLRQARQGTTGEVQLVAIMEATGMAWYPKTCVRCCGNIRAVTALIAGC